MRNVVALLILLFGSTSFASSEFISTNEDNKQQFKRIKNRWKTNQFIHIERGNPQSSTIRMDWHSAMWSLERVSGNIYRIKNRWKGTYLHNQNGRLTAGRIQTGWWSAMWVMENVHGTGFVRLKNRWKNTYLHIQRGRLELGPINQNWHSAMWSFTNINATNKPLSLPSTTYTASKPNSKPLTGYQKTHQQYKSYLASFRGTPKQVASAFLIDKGPVIINGLAMSKNLAFRKPYFKSVKFREDAVAGRFDRIARHIDLNDFRLQLNKIINAGNVFKSWSLGVAGGADFILGGSVEGGGVWSTKNTSTALGYLTYSYNLGLNLGGELALTMSLWTKDAHKIGGDMDGVTVMKVGSKFGAEIMVWLDLDKYRGNKTSIDAVIGFTFAPTVGVSTKQATSALRKAFTGKKGKGVNGKKFSADHARRHIYRNGREITNLPPLIDLRPVGKVITNAAKTVGKGIYDTGKATENYFSGGKKEKGSRYVTVLNSAGYVAKFVVKYRINGKEKKWKSGNMAIGHKKRFKIPSNATNIQVKGEAKKAFGGWKSIFKWRGQSYQNKCYKAYGTIFSPKYNNNCN